MQQASETENFPWLRGTVRGPMVGDRLELQPNASGLPGCPVGQILNPGRGLRSADCDVAITGDTLVEIGDLPSEWRDTYGLEGSVIGTLHPNGSLTLPNAIVIPVLPRALTVDVIQGGNSR